METAWTQDEDHRAEAGSWGIGSGLFPALRVSGHTPLHLDSWTKSLC